MPEKKSKLTALAARKQLLVLESDLNRAQLLDEAREWQTEFQRTKDHVLNLGSLAATAAKVVATVSTARRLFSRRGSDGKKSWISYLVGGVTTGVSLWNFIRSRRPKRDD